LEKFRQRVADRRRGVRRLRSLLSRRGNRPEFSNQEARRRVYCIRIHTYIIKIRISFSSIIIIIQYAYPSLVFP
jgi:hypothetical protein